jgi:hypothetical protein
MQSRPLVTVTRARPAASDAIAVNLTGSPMWSGAVWNDAEYHASFALCPRAALALAAEAFGDVVAGGGADVRVHEHADLMGDDTVPSGECARGY